MFAFAVPVTCTTLDSTLHTIFLEEAMRYPLQNKTDKKNTPTSNTFHHCPDTVGPKRATSNLSSRLAASQAHIFTLYILSLQDTPLVFLCISSFLIVRYGTALDMNAFGSGDKKCLHACLV
jgi:hypothetical protein